MTNRTCHHLSRVLIGVALLVLPRSSASADEADLVKHLKELGAEVTLTKDIVTAISFRDCSRLGEDDFKQIAQLAHLKRLVLYGSCKGLTDKTLPHVTGLS